MCSVGAGSAGGGEEGSGAPGINLSGRLVEETPACGKKPELHLGTVLVGAFGVAGSGSSTVVLLRLPLETTLPACETLRKFSTSVPKKCTPGKDVA